MNSRRAVFGRVARENGIKHRLVKPIHLWTNGEAERMVRTIKGLRRQVRDCLTAYSFAKHIKALRFETPYEAVEELWKSKPDIFIVKHGHYMLGPNT